MFKIKQKETAWLLLLTSGILLFSGFTALTGKMILWFILVGVLSLVFLWKYRRNIRKEFIAAGTVLCAVTMASNPFMGIFVFPVYVASMCMMQDKANRIALYKKSEDDKPLPATILCALVIGAILAFLNLALAAGSYDISVSFRLSHLLNALRAGIFEEIFFRMFLFALCAEILPAHVRYTRLQNIMCFCMMVLPHVLIHFKGSIPIGSVIVLSLFFGLPFAVMQRKVNLLSAILSHSMVDLVRFIALGV